MIDPANFKQGMRRLAAGVSLITTALNGSRFGLIATSVSSVSSDPPTLLVCVNRSSSAHDPIADSGLFCVNLLAEGDGDIAQQFSSSQNRHRRFEDGDWRSLRTGAPALAGSLASFDCTVLRTVEVSSHTIFIGEVSCVELWTDLRLPLVYLNGGYLNAAPVV